VVFVTTGHTTSTTPSSYNPYAPNPYGENGVPSHGAGPWHGYGFGWKPFPFPYWPGFPGYGYGHKGEQPYGNEEHPYQVPSYGPKPPPKWASIE